MAGWRRAVELALSDGDIAALAAISRSRTEPASRVERARMLLSYRKESSFFAVGRTMGVHHQTVQRCVEWAAGLRSDGRARGSATTRQAADDHGRGQGMGGESCLPQGQGSRLSSRVVDDASARPSCARARADRRAHLPCPPRSRHFVQHPQRARDKAAQGPLLPGAPRPGVQTEDGGGSVRLSGGQADQGEGAAAKQKPSDAIAIVSYDEKPGIQALATTAPDLPPEPGRHATFARDHEYKRNGTVSLLAGIDLLTGQVHALVKDRHRSREFIEFLKLLTPPIRSIPRSS